MKIGNTPDKPIGASTATDAAQAVGVKPGGKTGADALSVQPSTKVSLSPTVTQMAQGGEGSFDAAKVERVKQAIASGTYSINAEAIADKLIANARELLTPRQS